MAQEVKIRRFLGALFDATTKLAGDLLAPLCAAYHRFTPQRRTKYELTTRHEERRAMRASVIVGEPHLLAAGVR